MVWNILKNPLKKSKDDKQLIVAIENLAGLTPGNLALYKLATLHSSVGKENGIGYKESNERLEYLGDAILGAMVAEYLFKKFPLKSEGFLTEMRSKIVNRESLNLLARKIGIANIVVYDKKNENLRQVILGNTLEALVGAIYLDKGYIRCRRFVNEKLIAHNYNLDELANSNSNFKSKLIEWSQKEGKEIRFEIINVKKGGRHKEFQSQVWVNDEPIAIGFGGNKKKAEQDAALKASEQLQIPEN